MKRRTRTLTPVIPAANTNPVAGKPARRENTFSKSRDIREDRGARQVKTSLPPQSLPHGR